MLPNLSHEISPSPLLSTSTIKYKSDSLDQPEPGVQRQEAQGNGYVCNWKVIWRKPQFVFIFICDHHSSNRFPILFLLTRSTGQDNCFITPPPVFSLRSHGNLKEVVSTLQPPAFMDTRADCNPDPDQYPSTHNGWENKNPKS